MLKDLSINLCITTTWCQYVQFIICALQTATQSPSGTTVSSFLVIRQMMCVAAETDSAMQDSIRQFCDEIAGSEFAFQSYIKRKIC